VTCRTTLQRLIDQLHGSCFLWAFLNGMWTSKLSVALFSTLETNNVTSHWSVISLSFPTVLSSVAIHITISTSDCVGPGNILSSLICTHCIRLIPFVLFCLTSVYLISMRFVIVVDCLCHFFQVKFSLFFQEYLQWFVTSHNL